MDEAITNSWIAATVDRGHISCRRVAGRREARHVRQSDRGRERRGDRHQDIREKKEATQHVSGLYRTHQPGSRRIALAGLLLLEDRKSTPAAAEQPAC